MNKLIKLLSYLLLLFILPANSQWVLVTSGNGFDIFSLSFPSANTGYVCGYGNFLQKTTNGGTSWIDMSFPTTAQNLNAVFFTSENTGWLCSTNNNLYFTSNGGADWVVNYTPIYGNNIQFINTITGWVGAANKFIRTTNGGVNWTIINAETDGELFFVNDMTGWTTKFMSPNSTIYKTINGGFNWSVQFTSTDFKVIYDLHFINENTGWAVGYRETIMKTTNGGSSWFEQRFVSGSNGIYSCAFVNENTGWAVGDYSSSGSRILSTTNSGTNWNESFIGTGRLNKVQFVNSNTGYTAGQYNRVYKTTNLGGITEIEKGNKLSPESFILYQNYPNPFNPSTTIKFDIAKAGNASLKVYNSTGELITTLINKLLQPGSYEVKYDAGNLPSGIYFYKLTADKNSVEKKMVLVK